MKYVLPFIFLLVLTGCSNLVDDVQAYHDIENKNILFFDMDAEGIGVHGNGVFLPSCILASSVACMEILQMLPYNEFVPSDGIFIDPDIVSGAPVLLISLLDIAGNNIGTMATHSRIIGLEGKECLVISRSESMVLRDYTGAKLLINPCFQ